MNTILSLTASEAKEYFLKPSSYFYGDLPQYFNFEEILQILSTKLTGHVLNDFTIKTSKPRDLDDVNYKLYTNKDGKYAWRQLKLIHPFLYVNLVHLITKPQNWEEITNMIFDTIWESEHIYSVGMPVVTEGLETYKSHQITHWLNEVEKKSIELALEYDYLHCTDIVDCYGSLYTHSIPWAIHGKQFAKDNRRNNKLIGNNIDYELQSMSHGQTNGIPQGSTLMDFIAEIVLGWVDKLLSKQLKKLEINDYRIIRYRDDYRIFTNNPLTAELIIKELSEILIELGLKINSNKTFGENNVIHSSVKKDKRYWISYGKEYTSLHNELFAISLFATEFPNSGTLLKILTNFYERLYQLDNMKKIGNVNVLISLITDIAYNNPKVYPIATAILSILLESIEDDEKDTKMHYINMKFNKLPNTAIMQLWLQRITLKMDSKYTYTEKLCKKVLNNEVIIWNSDWLKEDIKKTLENCEIINRDVLMTISKIVNKEEVELFTSDEYIPF